MKIRKIREEEKGHVCCFEFYDAETKEMDICGGTASIRVVGQKDIFLCDKCIALRPCEVVLDKKLKKQG